MQIYFFINNFITKTPNLIGGQVVHFCLTTYIMGTYTPSLHRIRIYDRYSDKDNINTAIHEYAHHIHYTEKEKEAKNNRPHRPEFKLIYHALVVKAIQKGLVSNLLIDDLVAK